MRNSRAILILAVLCAFIAFADPTMAQSSDFFTDAGNEVTALKAKVLTFLGIALGVILVFLGWKYLKRAKGAA
jgi:hypothetical protein